MKYLKNLWTLVLLLIAFSSAYTQEKSSALSLVNRVYKFNAGNQEKPYYKGALEIKFSSPFRLRQNIDFLEISEVYNLDSLWKIPQCQQNIRVDSCYGQPMIFVFELWTQNDTLTLEYLEGNEVVESNQYILPVESFPRCSNLNLINGLKKHRINSSHHLNEFQGLNHFSVYLPDSLSDGQIAMTGLIDIKGDSLVFDTINIKTLSAIDIGPSIWAGRGYSKPEEYGVTTLYYGVTDSIGDQESWNTHKVSNLTLRALFIQDSLIYLLTNQGVSIFTGDSIKPDPSFKYHLETKNSSTFYGLFEYEGKPAIIFNENIFTQIDKEWQPIYTFEDKYKYETTAISFAKDSIYFVADRKLWFTDLDTTIQIRSDINDIMRIAKGPNNSILYKQGSINNCYHGGIYFINSKRNKALKREYLSEYPDLVINDIFYMKNSNKIIATSYPGVYEFELEEWLKKDDKIE